MRSWRSRIAAAAVIGAAAVTIPLTAAGSASAVTDPDGFHLAGGNRTHEACQEDGRYDLQFNGYHEFQCRWNASTGFWEEWVR
jgi:hypothetical protein